MKPALVVTYYNQTKALDLMLHSVRNSEYDGLVIVSCAKAGMLPQEFKDAQKGVIFTEPPDDRTTTHGVTADTGVRLAIDMGATLITQSNDDVVVPAEWFRVFLNEWEFLVEKHGKVGMLGASTNFIAGPQCRLTGDFGSNEVKEVRAIRAFFAMHSAEGYASVGGYPLDNPVNWFSDDVLAIRFLRAGYKSFVSRLFIPHFGSMTMRGRDLSDEKMKGEFYMSRYFRGWKRELYGPPATEEPAAKA